jgi:hypothetical protein
MELSARAAVLPHMPRTLTLAALFVVLACSNTALSKRAGNRPYVISGPDGAFYARGIPTGDDGIGGRTEVYEVGAERDTLLDTYDFYAPERVVLGWSPITGKVAMMAALNDSIPAKDWAAREELRFCLGGKVIKSYTAAELIALGAKEVVSRPGGVHPSFRLVGCEQVPGTNDYDFILDLDGGRQVRLDILTGEPRGKGTR